MGEVPISALNARSKMDRYTLKKDKLGLYIHVPFCRRKCPYCDFYSIPFDEELKDKYLKALEQEIIFSAREIDGIKADTLYFGGGTPSVLKPAEIEQLICRCKNYFFLSEDAEITLEANPESLDLKKLKDYRSAGINRLSLGVQSFIDEELKVLGRLHTVQKALQSYNQACRVGFDNIGIDLMLGLPQQKIKQWAYSLRQALQIKPQHLSTYILELKKNSCWTQKFLHKLPTDDAVEEMYNFTIEFLTAQGYQHYEISNFCLPGFPSYHNLKYWSNVPYIGFGPSAHSYYRNNRYNNVPDVYEYIKLIALSNSAIENMQALTTENRLEEALFLGLRVTAGIELRYFNKLYSIDIEAKYMNEIHRLQDAELLEISKGFLRLTQKGYLLSNEVFQAFLLD
jgi:oxygen-independent coproporphyrinogen-3 oxidase